MRALPVAIAVNGSDILQKQFTQLSSKYHPVLAKTITPENHSDSWV
jgi:hypothetical protein